MKHIFKITFMLVVQLMHAQQEIELLPSGILPPRLTEDERDDINNPQIGHTIYNIDAGRLESFSGFGVGNQKLWGNSSTFLLDHELDSRIQFRDYQSNTLEFHELLLIQMEGFPIVRLKKERSTEARIEIPDNGNNILLGGHEMQDSAFTENNIMIGNRAGHPEIVSAENILIGTSAGHLLNYPENVMIGHESGPQEINDISEPIGNTYVGYQSGHQRFGGQNVAVGHQAGLEGKGFSNTFLGWKAGSKVEGNSNIAIGREALETDEVTLGYQSSSHNIAIGRRAGHDVRGNDNVLIGRNAGAVQNQFSSTMNNTLIINSESITSDPLIKGRFDTKELRVNNKLGVGTDPTEALEVSGSVKIHNLLRLTPMLEPHGCIQESEVGDMYLDETDMVLRICIGGGSDFKWAELN